MHEWIQTIFQILTDLGYWGITIGLMIEVIPSEIVLAYGGFLISIGEINFIGAVIAGTVGGTLAHFFLYLFGYFLGRPFFDKYGKWFMIKEKHLLKVDDWFKEYGSAVVFIVRFIPVLRHVVSIPAGIARMHFPTFIILTTAAIIPWTILFLLIGIQLGDHWEMIEQVATPYLTPIITIASISIISYFLYKWWKKSKNKNGNLPIQK